MSYDLNFWKYSPGVYLEHQELYERLSAGTAVAGLEQLPVAEIRERIAKAFGDWERIGEHDWEKKAKVLSRYSPQLSMYESIAMVWKARK